MEGIDGVHHINVYSKGKTEIGRWLSNFTYCPIQTENGWFNSVEGYWYWISTLIDPLRELHGFAAKKLGKESEKIMEVSEDVFKSKIRKALDLKLKTNPKWVAEQCNLPLKHYYEYGGKRVEAEKHSWIIRHLEMRIRQLKEHYENK